MAPEQLHGHPSFASDQYTLGVITYEWLCGKRPFTGPEWPLIYQHLYATPPPLREQNPAVPASVEAVVLRALSKNPRERYVSIQGFAYGLARASQEMLHARPEDSQKTLLWPSPQLPLAGPQGEVLISASPHNGHTFTPPPHVQRESAQDPGISLQVRDPSSQHQVKTQQVVSSSKDANRQRLLAKVRAFWITGVLEHEQAEAIANPWHLVLASSTEQTHELPPRTPIAQVYADALGELLILGEPGSGKTTLLLELARTLLDHASQDGSHPMPVVFNLSSWAGKRQPLSEWIIEELNTKYQVPRKLATTWVESEQILPLLDGLDEVASTYRMACAEAINVYRLQHGLIPTVVCSRSAQYWAQPMHLLVRKAVVVQPLTQHQIDAYLASAGGQLDSVRIALRTYPALRELATTPLMLSVLTLTYLGTSAEDLLVASSPQAQRRLVFERYVECALVRRATTSRYTPQQTIHWLAWLARQMKQQSQTVFYIEQLQPNWLSGNRMHWLYDWLAIRLPGILIGILVGLAFYTLFFGVPDPAPALDSVLLGGLLGGILSGGSVTQRSTVSLGKASSAPWPRLLPGLGASLLYGLIIALKFGLPHGPDYEQLHDPIYILRHGPPHTPIYGLNVGLGYGLVFGLCSILFQVLLVKRKMAESPSWTAPSTWATRWQHLIKSAAIRNGLLVGLLFGLSYGVTRALSYGLSSGLTRGLTHGLAYGLMGGVLSL
ncbi:MAG: NACHT domain-containing protein, partial [Chloroflexi bacterium]